MKTPLLILILFCFLLQSCTLNKSNIRSYFFYESGKTFWQYEREGISINQSVHLSLFGPDIIYFIHFNIYCANNQKIPKIVNQKIRFRNSNDQITDIKPVFKTLSITTQNDSLKWWFSNYDYVGVSNRNLNIDDYFTKNNSLYNGWLEYYIDDEKFLQNNYYHIEGEIVVEIGEDVFYFPIDYECYLNVDLIKADIKKSRRGK